MLPKKHLACFFFGLISSAFEGEEESNNGRELEKRVAGQGGGRSITRHF